MTRSPASLKSTVGLGGKADFVAPPKTTIASALGISVGGIFCHSSDRTNDLAIQALLQNSNKIREKAIAIAAVRGRLHKVTNATTKLTQANPSG